MISLIKTQLHKDICKSPELHAFVLNLYLNGEEYPQKVNDYFPEDAVEDSELLLCMQSHMQDEEKHALFYRKTITGLEQPIVELPMVNIYNYVIKKYTPVSFHIFDSDNKDQKTEKLASFMAHLHFLEKRIATSLSFHLDACHLSPSDYPEKIVNKVLIDEQKHMDYTHNAVFDLLPYSKALKMMALHKAAEEQANLEFSAKQLQTVVSHYKQHLPSSHRWLYKISSNLMDWKLRYGF